MTVPRLIATVAGIGYIGKGSGTIVAALVTLGWVVTRTAEAAPAVQIGGVLIVSFIGVWAAGRVEKDWGEDSDRVVVDELAGMALSLVALPSGWGYALAAFVLFRFFDIVKPLGIARMEKLKGGQGVMADDILAGLYTNVLLQVVAYTSSVLS